MGNNNQKESRMGDMSFTDQTESTDGVPTSRFLENTGHDSSPDEEADNRVPITNQAQSADGAIDKRVPRWVSNQAKLLNLQAMNTLGIHDEDDGDDNVIISKLNPAKPKPRKYQTGNDPLDLTKWEVAPEGIEYCPFALIQKFPYRFVSKGNQDRVIYYFEENLLGKVKMMKKKTYWSTESEYIMEKTELMEHVGQIEKENPGKRGWDLFCLHDPGRDWEPLILVPTDQFEVFLNEMNDNLDTNVVIPEGYQLSRRFAITFGDLDTPRPRYLGYATNEVRYHQLVMNLEWRDDSKHIDAKTLKLFKEKFDKIYHYAHKGTIEKVSDKKLQKRIAKHKAWSAEIKRAQRYLGLLPRTAYVKQSGHIDSAWVFNLPPPYPQEKRGVRFVCVDIETFEHNHCIVTEVGLAVLDAEDVVNTGPMEKGQGWHPFIRAHHLRVKDFSYMVNKEFVKGCPKNFNFGKTEWVFQADLARRVQQIIESDEAYSRGRPIVFVGHDLASDLKYLRNIGYNPWKNPQFLDEIDTKNMFQRLQLCNEGRKLQHVCSELGLFGIFFHNAGNDAVYTLEAMLAMAIKKKFGGLPMSSMPWKPEECPDEEDWTDGEQDDGGDAVKSDEPTETHLEKPKELKDPEPIQW